MLTVTSGDGVYKISAPDDARIAKIPFDLDRFDETKYDRIQDVYLEVIAGKKANLTNLAYAIYYDCFDNIESGLCLLAGELNCHVKTEKNNYEFTVPNYGLFSALLEDLGKKIEI